MFAARLFVYFLIFLSIMVYTMKKTIFCIITLITLCFTLKLNGGTVFKGGENTVFYFFSSNQNVCDTEKPCAEEKLFGIYAGTKKGECCDMTEKEISKTLEVLNAKKVFSERGEDFENVYYYSPKIPDFVTVSGKKINIHVSYGKENGEKIKIATPINYGGY